MTITWRQALAWRLGRHGLAPAGDGTVAEAVGRCVAVPAWPRPTAELAIGLRRAGSRPGALDAALGREEVVVVHAFRGATQLMTVDAAATVLPLRASGRQWERRSWQDAYGLAPEDWPAFRAAVREAVAAGPLTREALREAVGRRRRFRPAADGVTAASGTLVKALMWQGDLCFGPVRDGEATLRGLADVPGWPGVRDLDDAGRRAIEAYLHAYGPAPVDRLEHWIGKGLSVPRTAIARWIGDLADRLATVQVEGDAALLLAEDLDGLAAARPSDAVHLLPGADPWIMGPGTDDAHVVPPRIRPALSRGASPVVSGGVVTGTWTVRRDVVVVEQPPGAGALEPEALRDGVERLAGARGTALGVRLAADAPLSS